MKEWRLSSELTISLQGGGAQICGNPWNVLQLLWCGGFALQTKWTHCLELRLRVLEAGMQQWIAWKITNCPELKADDFLQIASQVWHHRLDSLRLSSRLAPFCIFVICTQYFVNFINILKKSWYSGLEMSPYMLEQTTLSARERSYTSK